MRASRKKLLDDHFEQLSASLPIRPPVTVSSLELQRAEQYTKLIGAIKKHMRLTMKLRVRYEDEYDPKGAVAWINLPPHIAPYGTKEFERMQFRIHLAKPFLAEAPFESVVFTIAHECAHIVLESIGHPLRKKERAVDITAMMLGFDQFYLTGHTYTTTKPKEVGVWNIFLTKLHNPLSALRFLYYMHQAGNPSFQITTESTCSIGYLKAEEVEYIAEKIASARKQ